MPPSVTRLVAVVARGRAPHRSLLSRGGLGAVAVLVIANERNELAGALSCALDKALHPGERGPTGHVHAIHTIELHNVAVVTHQKHAVFVTRIICHGYLLAAVRRGVVWFCQ